ncbi:DUF3135 domain-containing protein [Amphritea pacifica]|uniref:DUF3135 domain-containing protein n=1 Tax=Amphritea pacifica TaxID=2811233 RepID=A0ABS2W2C7_9GAMM|nr:DUF3135 domain-containing protein [Amphritea pacifica]MBN0985862.1 DUF3135 domain-containing protein [Amphritea pacifica]MBN1005943.1 DUF3135 domain-containing protein [Amphritea pacifica]
MQHPYKPLDFDHLSELAQIKPRVLERYLRWQINKLISRAKPEERVRLRQLQFRIDAIRYRSKTPLAACIKISQMMHDEFWRLRQALNYTTEEPNNLVVTEASPDRTARSRGKVVVLPPRTDADSRSAEKNNHKGF